MSSPSNATESTSHQWAEERVFSADTLKRECRRWCVRCGTDPTTHALNPQPCPGPRPQRWVW
jgi:hypothetical protein